MKTSILAIAALGAAAYLLMTTEKGKKIRNRVADSAEDFGDYFADFVHRSGDQLGSLKSLIANEISGLSEDARERIMTILDEGAAKGKKLKKDVRAQLS